MGKAAFAQHHAFRAATWIAVLVLVLALTLCLCTGPVLAAAEGGTSILKPPPATSQRRALIASVSRMDRGNAAGGDVYFVGFAGYGEQQVFRKEAQLGQRVFGARFATGNRSLLLVNDIHDRRSYPLATFEDLRVAVNAIGRRMHPDRDTLVLLLTSHGNDEDGIAITNGKMPEDALSHACSLTQAYTDMARIIDRRERDEGEIHSNPQLFVGPRMRAKLTQLDAAAARSCSPRPARPPA